jgi:micrococcal nuclease
MITKVAVRGIFGVLIVIVGAACSAQQPASTPAPPAETATPTVTPPPADTATPLPTPTATLTPTATVPAGESAKLVEVVDGDTIVVEVNQQVAEVRYIGIDTPEKGDPCGEDARAVNEGILEGTTLTLVKDTSNTDRFGRLLRYVFAGNTFVNATLLREGWAIASKYPPDTLHAEEFLILEQEARVQNTGCWPTIGITLTSTPQPKPEACDCTGPDLNCRAFDTHDEAQACFEGCAIERGFDVFRLDGDGNGSACESLP